MRMPDPGRKHRRHLDVLLADLPELAVVMDSFEQKVQRLKDAAERDAWYSGKKKTHTIKYQEPDGGGRRHGRDRRRG